METKILIKTNDVHSPDFESKLDECFKAEKKNKAQRPSPQARYWAQGIMGVRSPVTKL